MVPVQYLIYVLIKLAFYAGWCWLGLRIWRPSSLSWGEATVFGMLRLAIGVVFGTVIFFVVPAEPNDLLSKYLAIYTPVRLLEWLMLAWIIRRTADIKRPGIGLLWCGGGILVSFIADFASPEEVAGHFCVGRCLC